MSAFNAKFHWESYLPDTGCRWSPSCLDCPLPKCVHDMTKSEGQRLWAWARGRPVVEAYERHRAANPGLGPMAAVRLAAEDLGVNPRTVHRALAREREWEAGR